MTLIARKLPFIFAAIFAAGFVASAANAAGFYINPAGRANYIALDYPTSAEAEMVARQACRDNFLNDNRDPTISDTQRCEVSNIGTILAFETDSILAYNRSGHAGMGITRQAAYDALLADCLRPGTLTPTECMNSAVPAEVRFCGDGTAADAITATYPAPDHGECLRGPPACDGNTAQLVQPTMDACECIADGDVLNMDGLSCFTPPACDGNTARLVQPTMDACVCIDGYQPITGNDLMCELIPPNCDDESTVPNGNMCDCKDGYQPITGNDLMCALILPNCDKESTGLNMDTNMCDCKDGYQPITGNDLMCELIPPNCDKESTGLNMDTNMCDCKSGYQEMTPPNPLMCELIPPPPAAKKKDDSARLAGGLLVIGLMAGLFYTHGGDYFTFSPDYGYSITESGYSANAGGRADFHKDNWHLYYSGGQTNTDGKFGEFRYSSGGTYSADIWKAAFSESVAGKTADYDLSLSTNFGGGIWKISPVYRLHSEYDYDNGESETNNTLNLEGILRYNRWTIRPAAGFRWENADEFADNARFRMNAVYRF